MTDKPTKTGAVKASGTLPCYLLPCPFCGQPPSFETHRNKQMRTGYEQRIVCNNIVCLADLEVGMPTKQEAIDGWNNRLVNSLTGEAKANLYRVAADLLTKRMSEYRDDYPKSMPVSVINEIGRHNEFLRKIAIYLRTVIDSTKSR